MKDDHARHLPRYTSTYQEPIAIVKPRTSPVLGIVSGVLLLVAVLFFILWICLFPVYVGPSGTTTGTIVDSPTSHPVISYTVDGTQYTMKSETNMPSWTLGQEITVMYNPRNPAQANDYVGHGFVVSDQFIVLAFTLATIGTGIGAYRKLQEARWPVAHGERIEATITGVTRTYLHQGPEGATVLGRVTCEWTSPNGVTHQFRTAGVSRSATSPSQPFLSISIPAARRSGTMWTIRSCLEKLAAG